MRHTFSAEFLKVTPPATNFGEAWELLCLTLLRAETSDSSIQRLAPPDRGVDILRTNAGIAYQCKSSERGVYGTINPEDCLSSFRTAIAAKAALGWTEYFLAINAPLTGAGLSKLNEFADSNGVRRPNVLPPEHWAGLCDEHRVLIEAFFDYRVFVTESDVIEALRKARYYDHVVLAAEESMKSSPLTVALGNNRTPINLQIPFARDMTVEKLVDVAQQLMGINLDWANFPDLGTSCGPSLSVVVGRVAQPFKLTLGELTDEQRLKLQLWIKLVWKDELQTGERHFDGTFLYMRRATQYSDLVITGKNSRERGEETVERAEALVQDSMWHAIAGRRSINGG